MLVSFGGPAPQGTC